jgi:hypothetical protein
LVEAQLSALGDGGGRSLLTDRLDDPRQVAVVLALVGWPAGGAEPFEGGV